MTEQRLSPPLKHRDDCQCECHGHSWFMVMDDGECGSPPDYGPWCCYGYPGSPKLPPREKCGLCDKSNLRLAKCEGLNLCRACRKSLR